MKMSFSNICRLGHFGHSNYRFRKIKKKQEIFLQTLDTKRLDSSEIYDICQIKLLIFNNKSFFDLTD